MKTLLVGVNSQYIHSNLAVWQLKANCTPDLGIVCVKEYNINQQRKWVYSDLVGEAPDVVAFSCYIWNIEFVRKLAKDLKSALPQIVILLGGPEVSFDYEQLLTDNDSIDAILVGEGEHTFPAYLKRKISGLSAEIEGLCEHGNVHPTPYITQADFACLPSPYTQEMLQSTAGKILYYESSRGCPFSCSYCLSQISQGVRYIPIEQVKHTLLHLEQNGVELVKFVDRTFNCNAQRAVELWQFAKDELTTLRLHFEIGADLLDEAQLAVLASMPPQRVQLEAGVQSTNAKTLATVCRKTDLQKLKENSKKILSFGNIHYHLDLIAGLPFEDYQRFGESFCDIYALAPHQLQLGFLKMLKGSKIRAESDNYDYHFRSDPPYEVISNEFLSANQFIRLAKIEEAVERYYNTGRFLLSLPYFIEKFENSFHFFETLADYLDTQGAIDRSVSAANQFSMLFAFSATYFDQTEQDFFRELLRCDYLLSGLKGTIPPTLQTQTNAFNKTLASDFFEAQRFLDYELPQPQNKKEMGKRYEFAQFGANPFLPKNGFATMLLIDYQQKDENNNRYFSVIIA